MRVGHALPARRGVFGMQPSTCVEWGILGESGGKPKPLGLPQVQGA